MRIDFYILGDRGIAETAAMLARKTLDAGERLLIVAADPDLRREIGASLWRSAPEQFLAHGEAGGAHDARQPILLSGALEMANAARIILLADGQWRDPPETAARVLALFAEPQLAQARRLWADLGRQDGLTLQFWKHAQGRWQSGS